jgi:hypothetical protein
MQSQPTNELGFFDRLRRDGNIAAHVASVFAAFGEVLLRKGMGERYFNGLRTVAVVPLLLVFTVFFPHDDVRGLLLCVVVYLILCFKHRVAILRHRVRRLRGVEPQAVHSQYNGESLLTRNFPKLSEGALKRFAEPAVMACCGGVLLIVSPPVGWFFVLSAIGMFAYAHLLHARDEQRLLDLTDAALESELMAERFRHARSEQVRFHRRSL